MTSERELLLPGGARSGGARPATHASARRAAAVARCRRRRRRRCARLRPHGGPGRDTAQRRPLLRRALVDQGLVVDVSPMSSVSFDGKITSIGAVRLGNISRARSRRPYARGQLSAEVGIAGLTLSGGLGVLGHLYGLSGHACSRRGSCSPTAAPSKRTRRAGRNLFWGLHGLGGGRFGVVTSLAVQTLTAPAVAASVPPRLVAEHAPALHDGVAGVVAARRMQWPRACCSTAPSHPRRRSPPASSGPWRPLGAGRRRCWLSRRARRRPGHWSGSSSALPRDEARLAGTARARRCPGGLPFCSRRFFRRPLPSRHDPTG